MYLNFRSIDKIREATIATPVHWPSFCDIVSYAVIMLKQMPTKADPGRQE